MSSEPSGKVFLVDDDRRLLSAISRLLRTEGFDVVPFTSPAEFLEQHDPETPGCAILDIGLGATSGFAVHEILRAGPVPRPVIFLTGCDDVRVGVTAMKSGALDYLTKPVRDEALFASVRYALEYDRNAREEWRRVNACRLLYQTLSPREREVLERILAGRLNKQIAFELGTVEKTVKVHRGRIFQKMQVRSVAALVHMIDALRAAEKKSI